MKKIVLTDAGNGIQLVYMLTKQNKWIQIMFGCAGQPYSVNFDNYAPSLMKHWQHTTLYEATGEAVSEATHYDYRNLTEPLQETVK